MDRLSSGPYRGFTLIELLIVLLLAALVMAAGAPGMRQLVADNRVHVESRRLLSALQLARSAAVAGNTVVSLCPSSAAVTGRYTCGGTYAGGWLVYTNPAADPALQVSRDRVIRVFQALPTGYRVSNRQDTRNLDEIISYRADGAANRNLTLQVCPPDGSSARPISVVLSMVGRARLQRDWGSCRGLS